MKVKNKVFIGILVGVLPVSIISSVVAYKIINDNKKTSIEKNELFTESEEKGIQESLKNESIENLDKVINETFEKSLKFNYNIDPNKNNELSNEAKEFVLKTAKEFVRDYREGHRNIDDVFKMAENAGYSKIKLELKAKIDQIKKIRENISENNSNNNDNNKTQKIKKNLELLHKPWRGTYRDIANSIKKSAITSTAVAGVGWALAAGYWAGAAFFGLTVPSAIAATTQATILSAEAVAYWAAYGIITNHESFNLSIVDQIIVAEHVYSHYSFIKNVKTTLYGLNIAIKAVRFTLLGTVFAAPQGLTVVHIWDIISSMASTVEEIFEL
ncbi:unknown; predicted coding region [Mycoplasmopsis pulmonis]|uniref:Uncharacterized protein n=1 Tax=Mycoplasmopsis pulmonis (strain UAB CTIP) TaxID=272635 RepID=Q98R62_MYCPU|nr:hypothetical protein [Mycoplasmopsis pulmonis]CAC13321.1 unknown; predicted coding region [Mycoplasmopsis pulmonis]VEU67913.1 Uncharacterised protein [Mycoplasmopsis pulmonis]